MLGIELALGLGLPLDGVKMTVPVWVEGSQLG